MSEEREVGHDIPPPAPASALQLTVRAVLTGMVLGAALSLCNLYTGLKLGWSTTMSVTAALLGFAVWKAFEPLARQRFGILENSISQTAASSAAYVSSAGLVAPIPALTMLTGMELSWPLLSLWVLSVMLVGILCGAAMRRQMLEVDALPFPFGIATAETLREMYARGREALAKVRALLIAGAVSGVLKTAKELLKLPRLTFDVGLPLSSPALAEKGITAASLKNLGLGLEPALLFVGVGALIGMRACVSLLGGALLGWGILAPEALERGWAEPGKADANALWFSSLVEWMLWPGVALMVASALTSFAISLPALLRRWTGGSRQPVEHAAAAGEERRDLPLRWFVGGLAVAMILSGLCQALLFEIRWWMAVLGVVLSFGLAIVAGRVSGETGITPVGPMGKVTQLVFGIIKPDSVAANLMTANVTGGAASQCGDLLHDLKTGQLLGNWPRHQVVAQMFGAVSGAMAGSAAYLLIVPDPAGMLLTEEWPAPAVAQWRAVALLFKEGLDSLPGGALLAITVATAAGAALAVIERVVSPEHRKWVPSAASIGLSFVVPAHYSLSMFLGGLAALLAARWAKSFSARFAVVVASGLVVGESLAGVGFALRAVLAG